MPGELEGRMVTTIVIIQAPPGAGAPKPGWLAGPRARTAPGPALTQEESREGNLEPGAPAAPVGPLPRPKAAHQAPLPASSLSQASRCLSLCFFNTSPPPISPFPPPLPPGVQSPLPPRLLWSGTGSLGRASV